MRLSLPPPPPPTPAGTGKRDDSAPTFPLTAAPLLHHAHLTHCAPPPHTAGVEVGGGGMPKRGVVGSLQGPPQSPGASLRGMVDPRGGVDHAGPMGPMGAMGMGPRMDAGKGPGVGDGRGEMADLGEGRPARLMRSPGSGGTAAPPSPVLAAAVLLRGSRCGAQSACFWPP